MSEYYAVQRSTDHLAHYGVKGMRWGVRKAIESGNVARLAKHYNKASNKLKKLKDRADPKLMKQQAKDSAAAGAVGLGMGALGGLASYGMIKGQLAAQSHRPYALVVHPTGLYGASALSAGAGIGALGSSVASAYRATKRGNKKAVEKYKTFKREMGKAFNKSSQKKAQQYIKQHKDEFYDYTPIEYRPPEKSNKKKRR